MPVSLLKPSSISMFYMLHTILKPLDGHPGCITDISSMTWAYSAYKGMGFWFVMVHYTTLTDY